MPINPDRLAQLNTITLNRGSHKAWDKGHCAMEVVAWLAGLGHTDAPSCASPVLRGYTIRLNDRWSDEERQLLKPYLPRMVGTADDGQDAARLALARRALTEDLLPAWLRLAGMDSDAEQIATMGAASAADVRAALRRIRSAAWDARRRWREKLTAKIREHLAARPAEAAAVAVAVAVAAAAAAAVAEAVAEAAAAAAAAAAAEAVAEAAAEAAAAAAAEAVAEAAAEAAAEGSSTWNAAYAAALPIWRKWVAEADAAKPIRELRDQQRDAALDLLDRMIDPASADQ